MSTVFSRIIAGELPGRFVWSDDDCVSLLTVEPLAPGHALIVPRQPIDQWVDLSEELTRHVFGVARHIGLGMREAFKPARIGMMLQGFEVPHMHVHVWPANTPGDFNLANVERSPSPESLDEAGEKLRSALRDLGYGAWVPPNMASPGLETDSSR